jgi:hypothetical protein
LTERLEQHRRDGCHRVAGWETESDQALDSSLGVVEEAQAIAIGAAILTAVAALELSLSRTP